jgi:prepilin-type N-terminal cleavage/methylation domain-containing protein
MKTPLHPSWPRFARTRAFTLIELLIVIAIIGILMSLMFPAVNSALNSARRASAQNDVTQIANAITMFQTEYGRLPEPTATTVSGQLLTALTGQNDTLNPRRIVFLEAQGARRNRSGTNSSGQFVDPWAGVYQVVMDHDYDNTVSIPAGQRVDPSTTTLRRTVAVWNTNASERLRVGSW